MVKTREKIQCEHVTCRCVRDDGRSRYEVIIALASGDADRCRL